MKKFSLAIAEPCHEAWDQMTPQDKGRHCAACQKTVIDFTAMTDLEIAAYLKKGKGSSVCGRFYQDQLNREIKMPPYKFPLPKQMFPYTLPAFLLMLNSCDQEDKMVKGVAIEVPTKMEIAVMGRVSMPEIMPDVDSVLLKEEQVVVESKNVVMGDSIISPQDILLPRDTIKGEIAIKHSTNEIDTIANSQVLTDTLATCQPEEKKKSIILGRIAVTKLPVKQIVQIDENEATQEAKLEQGSFVMQLYPNPLPLGQCLTVLFKQKIQAQYQVISVSGQVISSGRLVAEQNSPTKIELPATAAGSYILYVVDEETKKTYSQKVIVK